MGCDLRQLARLALTAGVLLAVVGVVLVPAVWVYGMYDAFQGAKRYNLLHSARPGP